MPSQNQTEQIAELRARLTPILKRYQITQAIVFGSFARGDVSPHSDIDLILIQQTQQRFWERYTGVLEELNRCIPERAVDVLIYTPAELERIAHRAFIQTALREGKVIYESE